MPMNRKEKSQVPTEFYIPKFETYISNFGINVTHEHWQQDAGLGAAAWVVEIGSISCPDSLHASCRRLPYPHADRSHHVRNLSPSLTDDVRVKHDCPISPFLLYQSVYIPKVQMFFIAEYKTIILYLWGGDGEEKRGKSKISRVPRTRVRGTRVVSQNCLTILTNPTRSN